MPNLPSCPILLPPVQPRWGGAGRTEGTEATGPQGEAEESSTGGSKGGGKAAGGKDTGTDKGNDKGGAEGVEGRVELPQYQGIRIYLSTPFGDMLKEREAFKRRCCPPLPTPFPSWIHRPSHEHSQCLRECGSESWLYGNKVFLLCVESSTVVDFVTCI